MTILVIFWLLGIISFFQESESDEPEEPVKPTLASKIEQSEPIEIDRKEQNVRLEELKSKKLNKSQQKIRQDAKEWK